MHLCAPLSCLSVCVMFLCVCVCVNQGGTNESCHMCKQVIQQVDTLTDIGRQLSLIYDSKDPQKQCRVDLCYTIVSGVGLFYFLFNSSYRQQDITLYRLSNT